MTNEKTLSEALNKFHYNILSELSDEARERGEDNLADGYIWLRDNHKWPYEFKCKENKGSFNFTRVDSIGFSYYISFWTGIGFSNCFDALKEAAVLAGEKINNIDDFNHEDYRHE